MIKIASILLASAVWMQGCASAPWVCTPQTCVSVAKADLPDSVRGSWTAPDGSSLRVIDALLGEADDLEHAAVAPKAATGRVTNPDATFYELHITSFDGSIVVGEQYLGGMLTRRDRSPRRFYRIRAERDRLTLQRLDPQALRDAYQGDDLGLVESDGQTAVIYTDVRAMAAVMADLLARDDAWDEPKMYTKDDA